MTDDEFERLKEEEKEHIRQIRALKKAARLLKRQRSVTDALEEMTSRSRAALEASERFIEEIGLDAAHAEARMEVATEDVISDHPSLEEEAKVLRARAILDELRDPATTKSGKSDRPKEEPEKEGESKTDDREKLPEKTLGRMR